MRRPCRILGIAVPLALLAGCKADPIVVQGVDPSFMKGVNRIAVMDFTQMMGPMMPGANNPFAGTPLAGATVIVAPGGGGGPAGGVVIGPGAGGAGAAGVPPGGGGAVGGGPGAGGGPPAVPGVPVTPDSATLRKITEGVVVRYGIGKFDVIERERFELLLREKGINDTTFKDQSAMNLKEIGEKIGVDAYVYGGIENMVQDRVGRIEHWRLVASVKVIDTRSAKVWYHEVFETAGFSKFECFKKWAEMVGKALTNERFTVSPI